MPLNLKRALLDVGLSQAKLAGLVRVKGKRTLSASSIAQIVNHDAWPRSIDRASIEQQIREALAKRGVSRAKLKRLFERAPQASAAGAADAIPSSKQSCLNPEELIHMFKQPLTQEARQHFKIHEDVHPFVNEMNAPDDVYLSDDIRYIRAAMRRTAKHGGMLAVVGESGAGKSVIRRDLKGRLAAEREPVTIIEPYVLGMQPSERRGQTLQAMDVAGVIIRSIDRTATLKRNSQERSDQLHQLLKASDDNGRRHVLLIEEAHSLPESTLKHLKRFHDLETSSGHGQLLSIILIGQTELRWKLDDRNPNVREVTQRVELATLGPLDREVHAYLKHKFGRIGLDSDAILDASAIQEIQARLRVSAVEGRGAARRTITRSLCYPLAVNNLVTIALNQAARIGAPIINGELIAAAMRAQVTEV